MANESAQLLNQVARIIRAYAVRGQAARPRKIDYSNHGRLLYPENLAPDYSREILIVPRNDSADVGVSNVFRTPSTTRAAPRPGFAEFIGRRRAISAKVPCNVRYYGLLSTDS